MDIWWVYFKDVTDNAQAFSGLKNTGMTINGGYEP
jgi:hypothetical protein